MSDNASVDRNAATRWQAQSLWAGIAVLSVCFVVATYHPIQFLRAYLASYLFYLGIALGSMVLLMVYHMTGGSWGYLIRRILEAGMRTLPLLAVFFLPIALGIGYLYLWAQPGAVAASPKLQYQQFYLAPVYFWTRAAIYFLLWTAMAFFLASWSRKQDQTGDPRLAWKSLQLSAYGAVAYGISLHFVAVDWGMSLQPQFHSTIWGPLFAAGQLLSGLAFALVVLAYLANRPPLAEVISLKARNDLASLLLTLLILWAYMVWFQFMLIWIANLPVDVIWYLPRASTPWLCVIWAIALLHFAAPFFLLLMRPIKRNSKAVAWIAGLILLMQLTVNYYQVMPAFSATELGAHWMEFLVPVGIGAVWLAHFMVQLRANPLLPPHDYNRAAALHLRSLDAEEAAREEALVLMEEAAAVAVPPIAEGRGDETRAIHYPDGRIEHPAARHEPRDIRIRWLLAVAAGVCCFAALQYYGVWRFLWYQAHVEAEAKKSPYPSPPPASTAAPPEQPRSQREVYTGLPPSTALPAKPRLDQIDRLAGVESSNVYDRLAAKEKALHRYGPTAEEGFDHIPIERAIKAVAGALPVAKESPQGRADNNGLLEAGESNSGRMFRGPAP